jgi:hypothetical protein
VHVHDPVVLGFRVVLEPLADVHPCIVEQDVDRPQRGLRLAREGAARGDVHDVHRTVQRAPPESADFARRLLGFCSVIEMTECDVGALRREGERRGAADAT